MAILLLCRLSCEMPIPVHFGEVFLGFGPLNVMTYCRDPQKAHHWPKTRVWYIVPNAHRSRNGWNGYKMADVSTNRPLRLSLMLCFVMSIYNKLDLKYIRDITISFYNAEGQNSYQITSDLINQARQLVIAVYTNRSGSFEDCDLAKLRAYKFLNNRSTMLKLLPPTRCIPSTSTACSSGNYYR